MPFLKRIRHFTGALHRASAPFIFLTALATTALLLLNPTASRAQGSVAEAERQADSLLEYQLPNGGILVEDPYFESARVVPYFGNFAALGWTETAAATTDTVKRGTYLKAAREWMDWYSDHQNSDGTIYDFEGTSTSLHSTGEYDSTDSYPATYAMLVWRYYKATNDVAYLRAKLASLNAAYSAMFLTMDAEGLTYAKPGYYYRYLMDNCEVAAGLASFQKIYTLLDETELAAHAEAALAKMKPEFAAMYQPDKGVFGFALDPFGRVSGSFSKGYPDAMANLFALAFLAPQTPESAALLDKVEAAFWTRPDAQDFPQWWLWAAMACGDTELQKAAFDRLQKQAESATAYSFLKGMAAATYCSGLESIRHPEAVCDWHQLTTQTPEPAVQADSQNLAGEGTSLFITYRNSTGTIVGSGWRTLSLALPAQIEFEITTATGYLLLNMVFDSPLNLSGSEGILFAYTAPANVPMQLKVILVEQDGDWWDGSVPVTTPGENAARIDFAKLTPNPWGKSGDRKPSLEAVLGFRLHLENRGAGTANGAVTLKEISLINNQSTLDKRTTPVLSTAENNDVR